MLVHKIGTVFVLLTHQLSYRICTDLNRRGLGGGNCPRCPPPRGDATL